MKKMILGNAIIAVFSAILVGQFALGDAVIFSGANVKALKDNLDLNGKGKIMSGAVDPTSSATSAPLGALYLNTSNGNVYRKMDAGSSTNWTLINSNVGINYVGLNSSFLLATPNNRDAENSVGDWVTFDDGAVTEPVDMTGGSAAQITFSRTTTGGEVLNGLGSFKIVKAAANAQGEGVSVLVNIPPAYRGQNAQITIPVRLISGSLPSSNLKVVGYDVTNSTPLSISNRSIENSTTSTSQFIVANTTIQSTTTQVRLGIFFGSTDATAATFSFDDVVLGPPTNIGNVTLAEDCKTDSNFSPSAGFGTVTLKSIQRCRVGDQMTVRGYFAAGTTAASVASLTLPSGYTIDTTKLTSTASVQILGTWNNLASGAGANIYSGDKGGVVFYDGSTNDRVFFAKVQGSNIFNKDNGSTLVASNDGFTLDFRVPIKEWANVGVAFRADQVANSWSGFHASDCAWSRSNAAYGNPGIDSSCTLTPLTNNNFGTVTSYNDGTPGNNYPGITFTPSKIGRYFVCAMVTASGASAGNGYEYRLYDGTTAIISKSITAKVTGNYEETVPLCSIYYVSDTTSKTLRVEMKDSGATGAKINQNALGNAVDWIIFQIDQSFPAPNLVNSVVHPGSSTATIAFANVSAAGAVSSESGDWINGSCSLSTSTFTCTINSGIFSLAPVCVCTTQQTGDRGCTINASPTSTQVVARTFVASTGADSAEIFHLQCMGIK